jgi:diguanylate cyclase (GGDEF)-like protein
MRRSLLSMLAGGLTLLVVGVAGGLSARTGESSRVRNALTHDAAEQSQVLDAYFARASSIILLTAHNPAFAQFYAEPGSRTERVARGGPAVDAANDALGYLEELYPDRIGEACFIDAGGAENARMVRGERATIADLSPDESANPFFAPSFALKLGQVYQAKPYVSPDTNEWVIANATPVPTADGAKPAIVHFEVTVESFRREARAHSDSTLLVVDAQTGAVVINSARPQRMDAPLGDPDDVRFRALVHAWKGAGQLTLGGRQAAYQRIAATPGNANHWYVVSVANQPTTIVSGVGILPFIMVLAAFVLIGFAVFTLRRGQAVLVTAANTDPLTGLYNRRRLTADLDSQLARATADDPVLLILCDLNGFKAYNDAFGHPAGDALLARLGATLATRIADRGRAYRIGGDEFCVVARPGRAGVDETVGIAVHALTEQGDGFSISAAHGAVLLPTDAATAEEAMRVVDLRMYEQKNSGRVSADTQTTNALIRAMRERDHSLAERLTTAADLAGRVARHLGVSPTDEAHIRQAAQLHDVGKVAVPDDILHKPEPLEPAEWAFVQQCPSIGERITAAAPALAPLAPLVRSARERYDGTGYPDRIAGDDIPLGARIIAACAAVAAMTSHRPYAERRDLAAALEELRRAAGTQFDPDVVAAILEVAREPTFAA